MSEQLQTGKITYTDSGALYNKPGLELVVVESERCRAVLALQGAQLLEFQARDRAPMLWLSPRAYFQEGVPIRGGIPLCMPWFGPGRESGLPKHGVARTRPWQLQSARECENGSVELVCTYNHTGDEMFTPFRCTVTMTLADTIALALELENTAGASAEFSWAWHTYFAVDDVRATRVLGLEKTDYLDNTRGLERGRQEGAVTFPGEVDRVYEDAGPAQRIDSASPVTTRSENCRSVITWNPGPQLAASMDDIGEHFGQFVCVEHGNAFANSWRLASGELAHARLELENG
ncbi:D-hexose-6-phosphate mutarotase [Microbulbifer yueqingensis]|uniref:Putative glucose-6-phosphate 1-epimerase n=1 Tax=Microbulbifer yueqingensis TaxID=658219 RepID=A0A1G8XGX8_9GAMM|nr:D-hexose-6-phosphate mutarotase [Microbulbifer yueqingensis]SDJ89554.1 glucose-6-phosphate 1-epimerase [Microbulbifer yueqingensis]